MKYIYQARTKDGNVETGEIESSSKEGAALLLQKYGVFVTSIEGHGKTGPLFKKIELFDRVSKKDLAIFFRQLSIMLEGGVPLAQSLVGLSNQAGKKNFKNAILEISQLVQEGLSLSGAFAAYPKIFDSFYISLVKSGEASGKIAEALHYVSDHLEKEADITAQVRQAMVYPVFVIIALFVVVALIITNLVPQIISLIDQTGSQPSFFVGLTLKFYQLLASYWWIFMAVLISLLVLIIYYLSTAQGRENYIMVSLRMPFAREFLKKIFLVRFSSNVATLLVAGVSINKALAITEDTVHNNIYKGIVSEIREKVSEGERMSMVMARHKDYFPLFVAQMVKVGEETGKLDKVLLEVVNFYQKEIKRTIDVFSALLEPIVIVILGLVVSVLAFSILSSLYGAISAI